MTVSRQYDSPDLAAPRGHFSHVVLAGGSAYVSGLLSFDERGQIVGADDVGAQAERIYDILETILSEVGMALSDVVQMTTYVTDIAQRGPANVVRARRFGDVRPASTLVEVSGLAAAHAVIEIDAVAVAR